MKTALVLQGGGARGVFTSGILDELLNSNIQIDAIYAVSAGALNATNFLSEQYGRSRIATTLTFKSKDFKSIKNVIHKRTYIDFDYYFNELNKVLPFDEETYQKNIHKLTVVATSLKTGKAQYFNGLKPKDFSKCIQASASLPLVSKPVKIKNNLYLDGGDSDPIPYKKALEDGYDRVILVITRPLTFRKDPQVDLAISNLYKIRYKNYPCYLSSLMSSHNNYNKEFDELSKYKDQIFVLEPSEPINLKHLEIDNTKLEYYYKVGRKIFLDNKEKLAKFIS